MTLKTNDIYLDLLPKYEFVANQFIQSTLFKNKIRYDKDCIEIKVSLDENRESSKLEIAGEITNILLKIIKEDIIKEYVYETYNRLLKKYSDIEVINMIKDVYLRFYKEFDEEKYKKELLELV